jgi:rubrerythrin
VSDGSERRALARELHTALLAEFGARAIYHRLARTVRDRDLAHLLAGFESDEEQQIAELRQLMLALGLRPAARSRRRWLLAEALAAVSVVVGRGSALRVCLEAEQQRARWYAHILEFLVLRGERRFDDVLQRMTTLKQVHAQSLGAWVSTTRWR